MTAQPEFDSTKSRIRIKLESFIDASHLNTLFVVFVCLFFKQGPWIPREMYKKKLKIRPGPILNSDWTRPPSKFQGQLGGFCETLLTNQLTNKTKFKKKTQVKKWPPWWRTGVYSPTRSYARHFNQLNTPPLRFSSSQSLVCSFWATRQHGGLRRRGPALPVDIQTHWGNEHNDS